MPTLTVKNFSCIEKAEITLADLTILIGPQASGKSVLSKLVYFFNSAIFRRFQAIEDDLTFDQFNESLCEEFSKWFPPSAWGLETFEISFRASSYFAKVTKVARAKSRPEVRIDFSDWFVKEYNYILDSAIEARKDIAARSERDIRAHGFDYIWRLREAADKRLRAELKSEYIDFQVFIPAGRSYFTSLGKALPAFEHSGLLDPVTVEFGRFFTNIRELRGRRLRHQREQKSPSRSASQVLGDKLFGGEIRFEREQGYVEGDDGRKVPLSFLSSLPRAPCVRSRHS